jgi:hypothetical protein
MTRLIVVVEGQTEEAFVKGVLAPHLATREIFASATVVGKLLAHRRGHRGRGGGHFRNWKRDIRRILGNDRSEDLRVTTLFDLYGLPEDFPRLADLSSIRDTAHRCDKLQVALGEIFSDPRLIPYLQRHELEALVLAALPSLEEVLDAEDDLAGLERLALEIESIEPEDVDDGRATAPSKRLLAHVPGYRKSLHGPLALEGAGLEMLRSRCPRFDAWICTLEELSR